MDKEQCGTVHRPPGPVVHRQMKALIKKIILGITVRLGLISN
jgi:hypothetical protein